MRRGRTVPLVRGRVDQQGRRLCCHCDEPVGPGRRDWCGDVCVIRYQVRRGDQGACRQWLCLTTNWLCERCGTSVRPDRQVPNSTNLERAEGCGYGTYPWVRNLPRWEADHRVPLAEGGDHDHANLRMLCVGCHRAVTRELRARLARARKATETST